MDETKIKYTIFQFNKDCAEIAEAYLKDHNRAPDIIIALVRGGTVMGTALSHLFGGSRLVCVEWSSSRQDYSTIKKQINAILQPDELPGPHKTFLIVDEIIDSGNVMHDFKHIVLDGIELDYKIASLVWNPHAILTPDYYGRILDRQKDKRFVDFFWEPKKLTIPEK